MKFTKDNLQIKKGDNCNYIFYLEGKDIKFVARLCNGIACIDG